MSASVAREAPIPFQDHRTNPHPLEKRKGTLFGTGDQVICVEEWIWHFDKEQPDPDYGMPVADPATPGDPFYLPDAGQQVALYVSDLSFRKRLLTSQKRASAYIEVSLHAQAALRSADPYPIGVELILESQHGRGFGKPIPVGFHSFERFEGRTIEKSQSIALADYEDIYGARLRFYLAPRVNERSGAAGVSIGTLRTVHGH